MEGIFIWAEEEVEEWGYDESCPTPLQVWTSLSVWSNEALSLSDALAKSAKIFPWAHKDGLFSFL